MTFDTELLCPSKFYKHFPVFISQILIVLSTELDAIYLTSGEKQTLVTILVCPVILYIYFPVSILQTFIVLSMDPETK